MWETEKREWVKTNKSQWGKRPKSDTDASTKNCPVLDTLQVWLAEWGFSGCAEWKCCRYRTKLSWVFLASQIATYCSLCVLPWQTVTIRVNPFGMYWCPAFTNPKAKQTIKWHRDPQQRFSCLAVTCLPEISPGAFKKMSWLITVLFCNHKNFIKVLPHWNMAFGIA